MSRRLGSLLLALAFNAGCDCSDLPLNGVHFECQSDGVCDGGGSVGGGSVGGGSVGGGSVGGGSVGGGSVGGGSVGGGSVGGGSVGGGSVGGGSVGGGSVGGGSAGGGSAGGGSVGGGSAGGGSVGGGSVGGGSAGGGGSPTDFCSLYAAVGCAREISCGLAPASTQSDCVLLSRASCAREIAADPHIMPPDGGSGCLSAISTSPCLPFFNAWPDLSFLAACATNPGLYSYGSDAGCAIDAQCRSGACTVSDQTLCGHCEPPRTQLQPCDLNRHNCDQTTWCALDAGSICLPLKPDGTPCADYSECTSADCSERADGGSTCGPPALGAICVAFSCAPNDYCRGFFEPPFDAGTCRTRIAIGQPCMNGQYDDGCVDGGSCLGGVCTVAFGTQAVTQPCVQTSECVDSAYCTNGDSRKLHNTNGTANTARGTCLPRGLTTDSCTTAPCVLTDFCSAAGPQTCTPRGAEGAPCQPDTTCLDFLGCAPGGTSGNSCQRYAKPGDACMGRQCIGTAAGALTFCLDGTGQMNDQGTCPVPQASGMACYDNDGCLSDSCTGSLGSQGMCIDACQ